MYACMYVCLQCSSLVGNLSYKCTFSETKRIYWQVESGKLVLEKAEFDLEAELTALIDVFSVQCDNKGLFICLHLAGETSDDLLCLLFELERLFPCFDF